MKLIKHFGIFLLLLATTMTYAQPPNKKARIKAFKIGFFSDQLALTPTESEKFWPIYNQFEADIKALRKQRPPKDQIEFMNDAQLNDLLNQFFNFQEKEINLRRKLTQDLNGVLPLRKIVKLQFVQRQFKGALKNKIRGKHGRKGGKKGKKRRNAPGPPMNDAPEPPMD